MNVPTAGPRVQTIETSENFAGGNAYGQTIDRYFRAAAERRTGRSAGRTSHHPVHLITSKACRALLQFFDGLKAEDLPDGQGWAVEQVQLSTHNGTHLDAPWHFHPTMNRGERSWTIDEVPLEWCLQPGVNSTSAICRTAMSRLCKGCRKREKHIGHTLSPLEIVVVNTSAGIKYGQQDYVTSGCGMGYEPVDVACSSAACG